MSPLLKYVLIIVLAISALVLIIFWPIRNSDLIVSDFSVESFFISFSKNFNAKYKIKNPDLPKTVPILMYHYIRDPKKLSTEDSVGRNLSVSANTFENHLKILKSRNLKLIKLKDLTAGNLTNPSAILTFDDGYADFYTDAYPLLAKYQATGTVFVITNKIDVLGYLSRQNINELSKNNLEIGSHTTSHPNLTNTSESNIYKQLIESKEILEGIIGEEVTSFAYPSGKYNEIIINALEETGFKGAVTTDEGVALVKNSKKNLRLPRLRMRENTDLEKVLTNYGF